MKQNTLMDSVLLAMTQAPSAHNTQPWKFKTTDNSIDVFVEWTRHLTVSDPNERQLYASIGCSIENGVIAGNYAGYISDVMIFPEGEGKDKPVARINFSEGYQRDNHIGELYNAIPKRRNNRSFYDVTPLSSQELSSLKRVGIEHVSYIDDRSKIQQIARATDGGNQQSLSRKDFKDELSKWIRNSWTKQPDGMPGYALEMPAVLSLVAPLMIKLMPIEKQEGEKVFKQVNSASMVVVVTTPEDTKQDFIQAGRVMQKIWLEATVAGLAIAALAPAIEGSEKTREQVRIAVGTKKCPQEILIIGHSSKSNQKATPRRTVEDCLVK